MRNGRCKDGKYPDSLEWGGYRMALNGVGIPVEWDLGDPTDDSGVRGQPSRLKACFAPFLPCCTDNRTQNDHCTHRDEPGDEGEDNSDAPVQVTVGDER